MSVEYWISEQVSNSEKVIKTDHFECPISLVGGLDISFVDQSAGIEEFEGVGALTILNYSNLKVVYSDCVVMKTEIPYIPGFLGFREGPFAEILFERLKTRAPQFMPQITFVDGCGIYHPRAFGSASQIGVNLDICTIGVSKSFLKLDGLNEDDFVINCDTPVTLPLINKEGLQVATALYTGTSKHPACYISIGHKISLETAVEIVKKCSISKIPEPIRQADLISRDFIRKQNKK